MATESLQYELKALVETDMSTPINPAILSTVLANPPFIPVLGIINIRDVGLSSSSHIRPGLVYRSGALNNLPASSLDILKNELGIKLILDLRSEREVARSPNPVIEGVKNVHIEGAGVPTPIEMNDFIEEGGKKGYVKMYEEVIEIYRPSIKACLEWIRDEGTPILFHCTAGKDRTGVLAAILLALANTPPSLIAYDYALTRIGIEPSRELLTQMLRMWNKDWTEDTPGMKEFSQVKGEFIVGLLERVEEKYGSVEGFVVGELGLSGEDVERVRAVLRA